MALNSRHTDIQTALNQAQAHGVIKTYLFSPKTGRYMIVTPHGETHDFGMQTAEAFVLGMVLMANRVGARV